MEKFDVKIGQFDPRRKVEVFELLKRCFGEKQHVRRDEAFWDWKHRLNPFGESLLLVAEIEDSIVGLRAFIKWEWEAGGNKFRAVRAVDTVTHPDYRRRGIFSGLVREGVDRVKREGFDFVFNTPNRLSMPGYLKMGWHHVSKLSMYAKILRPLRFITGITKSKVLKRVKERASDEPLFFNDDPVPARNMFYAERNIDKLIMKDNALRIGLLRTVRSLDFLKWRYGTHPHIKYYVQALKGKDSLNGMIIYRTNMRNGLREVVLSDMLLEDNSQEVVKEMIDALSHQVNADYLIAHFSEGSPHLSLLKKNGFYTLPWQGINFTLYPVLRVISPDPRIKSNWSLCLGDLEIL